MRSPTQLLALALVVASCAPTQSNVPTSHSATASSSSSTYASSSAMVPRAGAPSQADIEQAVKRAYANVRGVSEGKNADYIPELAKVDSHLFGIAVMRVDGELYEVGDTSTAFTIQSISKVFTLARALTDAGAAEIEKRIGADATGQAFNSIVALGLNKLQKRPPPGQSPFVNAGWTPSPPSTWSRARMRGERWKHLLGTTMNAFAGRALTVDERRSTKVGDRHQHARNQGGQLDPQKLI